MLYWYQKATAQAFQATVAALPMWFAGADLERSLHALALNCILLSALWPAACAVARRCSRRFAALKHHKQRYVVANCSKALCLAIVSMHPSFYDDMSHAYVHQAFTHGADNGMWIKRTSALYIATDIVALYMVPQLPATTVAHHWVAALLALCLFATDIQHANVTIMIAIYGAWSSLAWPVNLFLALRCVFDNEWWMQYLAYTALVTYVCSCCVNWLWHLQWLGQQVIADAVLFRWYGLCVLFYALSIAVVARDDVILMGWLKTRALQKRGQHCTQE